MKKISARFAAILYCTLFGGTALTVAFLSIKWDMNNAPAQCQSAGAQKSAFLVLNELDTNTGEFKGWFMVPDFVAGADKLELQSVSPGLDGNPNDYDYRPILSFQPDSKADTYEPWNEVRVPYSSRSYFYPFESYVSDIRIDFRKGTERIPLKLQVVNRIGEVVHYPCASQYSFAQSSGLPNSFSFTVRRHRFVRITAVVLYTVAIIFLWYIARKEETSKVLTNSLGYIAALWGIRQIITGNNKLFPTLVDVLTLALYLTVVSIVIFKWIVVERFSLAVKKPADDAEASK